MVASDDDRTPSRNDMIEVRIRTLSQLFNSFDPSPFPNRDLDDAAEEFIVGSAQELPSDTDIEIRVDVCEPDLETHNNAHASEQALRQSIHNYFAGRALIAERDMKELFRIGRRHLLVGIIVLSGCLVASQVLSTVVTVEPVSRILEESLIIVGWVANWKPIEIFLYDWWPIKRRIKLLNRLRNATVTLRLSETAPDQMVHNRLGNEAHSKS